MASLRRDWGPSGSRRASRSTTCARSARPRARTTRRSARRWARTISAVFFPCAGYVSDPQLAAHNAQRAAEAKGAASASTPRGPRSGARVAVSPASRWARARQPTRPVGSTSPARTGQGQPHGRDRGRHEDHDPRAQAGSCVRALPPASTSSAGLGDSILTSGYAASRRSAPPADRQRGPAVRCARVGRPGRLRPTLRAVAGVVAGRPAHPGPAGDQPGQRRGRSVRRTEDWIPIYDKSVCRASTGGRHSGDQAKNAPVVGAMYWPS